MVTVELYDAEEHIWAVHFVGEGSSYLTAEIAGTKYYIEVMPGGSEQSPGKEMYYYSVNLPHEGYWFLRGSSGFSAHVGETVRYRFILGGEPVTDGLIFDQDILEVTPVSEPGLEGVYAVTAKAVAEECQISHPDASNPVSVFINYPQSHQLQVQAIDPPHEDYSFQEAYSSLGRAKGTTEYVRPMLPDGQVVTENLISLDTDVVTVELYDEEEHIWALHFAGDWATYLTAEISGTQYRADINNAGPSEIPVEERLYLNLVYPPHEEYWILETYTGFSVDVGETVRYRFILGDEPVTGGLIFDKDILEVTPVSIPGLDGVYDVTAKAAAGECQISHQKASESVDVYISSNPLQIQVIDPPRTDYSFEGQYSGIGRDVGETAYIRPVMENGQVVTGELISQNTDVVTVELYNAEEHIWALNFVEEGSTCLIAEISGTQYFIEINPDGSNQISGERLYFNMVMLPHDDYRIADNTDFFTLHVGGSILLRFIHNNITVVDSLEYDSSAMELTPVSDCGLEGVWRVYAKAAGNYTIQYPFTSRGVGAWFYPPWTRLSNPEPVDSTASETTYRVQLQTEAPDVVTALIAYYSEAGQLLRMETVTLQSNMTELTVRSGKGETWKVMAVLTDGYIPLCEAVGPATGAVNR